MVNLKINAIGVAFFLAGTVSAVFGVGFLSIDADSRYQNTDFKKHTLALKALGLNVRKIIADQTSDRWVLFGQLEVTDNATNTDVHQLYAMLKGPMGKWNISAGKVRLPYGLLPSYSADRMPFTALHPYTLGTENDNGVVISGTFPMMTYALSLTQGAGVYDNVLNQRLVTGRVSFTPHESEDFSIGISTAYGNSKDSHASMPMVKQIRLSAIDIVGYAGSASYRAEGSLSSQTDYRQAAVFGSVDYTVLRALELNFASSAVRENDVFHHVWAFIGTTYYSNYVTLRGGYKYVYYGPIDHQITVQMYKLFSFTF